MKLTQHSRTTADVQRYVNASNALNSSKAVIHVNIEDEGSLDA
jgi:hypothetical protein